MNTFGNSSEMNENDQDSFINETQSFGPGTSQPPIPGNGDFVEVADFNVQKTSIYSWLSEDMHGISVDWNNYIFPVSIFIPRSFIPVSLQILCDFCVNEDILKIQFDQKNSQSSIEIRVTHPTLGEDFPGSIYIQDIVNKFIKKDLEIKKYYKSAPLVLFFNTEFEPNSESINTLVKKGFDQLQSEKALANCNNDYAKSIQLLQTGKFDSCDQLDVTSIIRYDENPIMYLVMEILDSLYDLEDHCCICRDPILRVLKPSPCEKSICRAQYSTMKLGISLISEIKRDIQLSDFLFTIFVSAIGTHFLIPPPPPLTSEALSVQRISEREQVHQAFDPSNKDLPLNHDPEYLKSVIKKIPSFQKLISFSNDEHLKSEIGNEAFRLLQFVLLTNRAQMVSLSSLKLDLPMFQSEKCHQFMRIEASQERESIFQQMKKVHGSFYLWHGSDVDKWHSILRNGLINTSRIKGMVLNGDACGPGIYLASDSSTSNGFSHLDSNKWPFSMMEKNFKVIALCEVIKLPLNTYQKIDVKVKNAATGQLETKTLEGFLRDNGGCYTLTLEEACIVRFVFTNFTNYIDVIQNNPSRQVPSFDKIAQKQIAQEQIAREKIAQKRIEKETK